MERLAGRSEAVEAADAEADVPRLVAVPGDLYEDDVADWLSDVYGWLVRAWREADPSEDSPAARVVPRQRAQD